MRKTGSETSTGQEKCQSVYSDPIHEFHAEHGDDDKGAGFQAQSGGEIFSALDPPQVK